MQNERQLKMTDDSMNAAMTEPAEQQPMPTPTSRNPHFCLFHASPSGKGSAIRFSVEPAASLKDGAVFFTIAPQDTVGTPGSATEPRRFPTFDWQSRITVKLSVTEVAEMLMVFSGIEAAMGRGGKGLYHSTANGSTTVSLRKSDDPEHAGYQLAVWRTSKATPDTKQAVYFTFSTVEAYALSTALEAKMGAVAFGV